MGTLEKMQAAGLADEEEELTPSLEPEAELELEVDPDPEGVVPEGEEEATLVLADDEQGHQGRVDVPKRTLSELRRTRREARAGEAQANSENDGLRAELAALKKATLKKPRYVDFTTDEAFESALLEYHTLADPAPRAAPRRAQAPAPQQQGPDFSEDVNAHLDRAEKLGVNLQKFVQAESAVRTTLGDLVTDAIISSVGEGSEKAIMLIGSRPAELAKVQQLLASDPSGLKVVSHLTRMAAKASVKGKTISGAPRPSRSPTGGSIPSATSKAFAKEEAKLEKSGDVQGMVELRRAARKAKAAAS
jgi:hypothetical protein